MIYFLIKVCHILTYIKKYELISIILHTLIMYVIELGYTCLLPYLVDIAISYIADIEVTYKDGSEASFNNDEYKKNTFVNAVLIHVNTVFIMPDEFSISDITNIIGKVICPSDSSFMFYNVKTYIGDVSNWDMLNVTNMTYMFYNCINISNLSKWDVSNVIYMTSTFSNCSNIPDLSKWDVSNVTNMTCMFYNCINIPDLSKWDVSKVMNMPYMFNKCSNIPDLSNWDVSKVTNMNCMFQYSSNIPDLSKWDVSKVTNMYHIFYNCLNSDIPQWYDPNINY
jgi:surface protein